MALEHKGIDMQKRNFLVTARVHADGREYPIDSAVELEVDEDGRPARDVFKGRVKPFAGNISSGGDSKKIIDGAIEEAAIIIDGAIEEAAIIIDGAKQDADLIRQESKKDAQAVLDDAEMKAKDILDKASEDAKKILDDAKASGNKNRN
jgi:F0F1-type ATP synthase membrane subunit b/b'